jgi:precorrin-2 dehydrogenase / sirohydrochlorin ferrochelatase
MTDAPLFPMFLKLAGRPCLVVGAGRIGQPKIRSLVECGARVRVVAPLATLAVVEMARRGAIDWTPGLFKTSDLNNIFLVVAATSSAAVNREIFETAQKQNILCNVVDDPPHCDFYYPAIVRRGHFQIAVSTNGRSPALAQKIRTQLEMQFPPICGEWLERLGQQRAGFMKFVNDPEARRRLIYESISEEMFREFQRNELIEAKRISTVLTNEESELGRQPSPSQLLIQATGKDLL